MLLFYTEFLPACGNRIWSKKTHPQSLKRWANKYSQQFLQFTQIPQMYTFMHSRWKSTELTSNNSFSLLVTAQLDSEYGLVNFQSLALIALFVQENVY